MVRHDCFYRRFQVVLKNQMDEIMGAIQALQRRFAGAGGGGAAAAGQQWSEAEWAQWKAQQAGGGGQNWN